VQKSFTGFVCTFWSIDKKLKKNHIEMEKIDIIRFLKRLAPLIIFFKFIFGKVPQIVPFVYQIFVK
jgi:hypothetical protein